MKSIFPAAVLPPTKPGLELDMAFESLAEWVRRVRNQKGLTFLEVERNSARRGKKIVASYVYRIENGFTRRPSADRLRALAHGLGEPVELVMAIAMGHAPSNKDSLELQLLAHFRELPLSYKEDLIGIARILNSEHGGTSGDSMP
jgi:transcriptional regulator with XRE-family HTH domain